MKMRLTNEDFTNISGGLTKRYPIRIPSGSCLRALVGWVKFHTNAIGQTVSFAIEPVYYTTNATSLALEVNYDTALFTAVTIATTVTTKTALTATPATASNYGPPLSYATDFSLKVSAPTGSGSGKFDLELMLDVGPTTTTP